jgi:presenilin-like A22 family membrane protease
MSLLIIVVIASYVLMLAAYFMPRQRAFHIPVMVSVIAFDLGLPVYLYMHRKWWHRLIEQQEIFSSLVWMHFAFFAVMYVLEAHQMITASKILTGDAAARKEHHAQGKILLVVRGLVVLSGAILAEPE